MKLKIFVAAIAAVFSLASCTSGIAELTQNTVGLVCCMDVARNLRHWMGISEIGQFSVAQFCYASKRQKARRVAG